VNDQTVADFAKLASLVLHHLLDRLWYGLRRPVRRLFGVRSSQPQRLLIAPQDIRTADPTVAVDIYAGYFVFDGKAVNTHGTSPFDIEPPSRAWAEALAGFSWLRHLRAADTSLARANARILVNDWIIHVGRSKRGSAWQPRIVARRLLVWLSQSPIILEGADGPFYRRFMRSLGRQTALLQDAIANGIGGEDRLFVAIALAEVGLCAEGLAGLQRRAVRILGDEIRRQILPDGGHVSRNPGILIELLLDLLPLRQVFAARGVPVPSALLNAIDRMIPMVRTYRHGDGALALFNGMGVTRPEALATVLAYDDTRGRPLHHAPYSGCERLEAEATVVILDAGPPPPTAFSRNAHAGTLAFELSAGRQRLVVNCGAPPIGQGPFREAARATAAHSTLVLADRSSSRFASRTIFAAWLGPLLYAGPRQVIVKRSELEDRITLDLSHDGYRARLGMLHHRSLSLGRNGERLEGEDRLNRVEPRGGTDQPFAIRFHLHHSLRTTPVRAGRAVLIAGPSGERWIFEAGGLPVEIEESIFFAGAEGPRATEQLVIQATTAKASTVVWSFSRRDRGAAQGFP
jgi:uncharacterized heparinase superfamily protein